MLLERLSYHNIHSPAHAAVVTEQGSLSYNELHLLSLNMAALLRKAGVGRGALVAIYTPRDTWSIVSMFSVLRAGGAYTFVEDDGATEENYFRLKAIEPDVVICEPRHAIHLNAFGLRTFIYPDAMAFEEGEEAPAHDPDDEAYVLFTSGSTGKPKGVSVTHRNIEHYTLSIRERMNVPDRLNYAHNSTLSADLGNTSIFLAILTGGTLHLLGLGMRKDPSAFRQYIRGCGVDVVKLTPSHWNALFPASTETNDLPMVEYLVLGGEAFPKHIAQRALASGRIKQVYNHYGPTETTVGVTVHPIRSMEELDALEGDVIPIGSALGETVLIVRDADGAFHTHGASGELHIGGPSVTKGYRNNPDATKAAFLTVEIEGKSLHCYKTGDLVSIDENGVVRFAGRVDRQVKLHGHRIELEHVESVMRAIPEVTDAAAFLLELNGRPRLVAAVIGGNTDLPKDVLRSRMQAVIPQYMIPSQFLHFDEFPRNANGKTNIGVLRDLMTERLENSSSTIAQPVAEPRGTFRSDAAATDQILALFRKHLRVEAVDHEDSFFDLGGDSLDAILFIAELQDSGYPVTAHDFLENPTPNGILAIASTRTGPSTTPPRQRRLVELTALSSAQREFFQQGLTVPDHYNQALFLKSSQSIDIETLNRTITWLLRRHPSLSVAYHADDRGICASQVPIHASDVISVSFISGLNDGDAQNHIARMSRKLNSALSLKEGITFGAHLFKKDNGEDHLLLSGRRPCLMADYNRRSHQILCRYSRRIRRPPAPQDYILGLGRTS